jgi:eukaryotic-like serine/threonine-protein kinase
MGLIKKVGTRAIGNAPPPDDGTKQIGTPEDATRQIGLPNDGTKQINVQAMPAADATRQISPEEESHQRSLAALQMLPAGQVLQGRYQIEEPIGIGGMSVVYRGRDLRFKDVARYCAVKEMTQSAPDTQTRMLNLRNFEREASLLATLQHAAIPKVYDYFEENGRVYVIQELIPGKDLETVLEDAGRPIDEPRVARWAIQICDVLSYLHNHKPEPIVFRDMKPSNVMVVGDERIVLIDFGIARTLNRDNQKKGTMIGTEGYSPPEQYRGVAEAVGDLYALGATMHHLLTASDPRLETPFTFHERPMRSLNPGISPEMEAIVVKALEYDMTTRWASAEEMKQALLSLGGVAPAMPAVAGAAPRAATPAKGGGSKAELLWSFTCEDEIRASPAVANGLVFVGCYDTNLYALDLSRGDFRWKYATEGGISSTPAIWQDYVYVGSLDGSVYGLDLRRGSLRWTFRTGKPVISSPKIEERAVVIGSDDQQVYAIDGLRGSQIWAYRTWMPIRSSACIANDCAYIGGNDGHVYCLEIRNGGLKWKQRTQQAVISTPTYGDGLIFVGSQDNNLYALDAEGGWPAWRYRTNHYVNSSPYLAGSRVFVGGVDGNLYALEAKNGRLAWKYETGSQIISSPRVESGRVYVGAVDGNVYCVDAGSGQLIWKYQTGGPITSSPAVAEGVVYIGSFDHKLYALKA